MLAHKAVNMCTVLNTLSSAGLYLPSILLDGKSQIQENSEFPVISVGQCMVRNKPTLKNTPGKAT